MISMELRKPHIQRQRRKLQEMLRRPGLPSTDREFARKALESLGAPKVYSADEPPQPGAIDPGPMPVVDIELELELDDMTYDSLTTLPHSRLYLYAQQEGLDIKPGDTKAVIVKTILAAQQGDEP
jgi:hypothetical protein